MFLVIGVMLATFELAHAQPFTCTELLGFSQTGQWSSTPEFLSQIDDPRWQARIAASKNLVAIADPNDSIWTMQPQSPCASGSASPDRIVLTATLNYFASSDADVVQRLRAAIVTIRQQRPSARTLVLQPVVGGPNDGLCGAGSARVRAAWNHPYLDRAIATVLGDAFDLVAGPSPTVRTCSDYSDTTGHLDPLPSAARGYVGGYVGAWFAEPPGTTTSTLVPQPTTTQPGGCKLLGQNCAVVSCCGPETCQQRPWGWRCL
jgi:hypothetical protein